MKNRDILRELGEVDEKYIIESDPTAAPIRRKRRGLRALALIAACFSVMIISASLWLFLPYSVELPETLEAERESEFFDVYNIIFQYSFEKANYPKNNYETIKRKIIKYLKAKNAEKDSDRIGIASDACSESGETWGTNTPIDTSAEYIEVTDNQVPGIIEADLIKRTSTHIFYLNTKSHINTYVQSYGITEDGGYRLERTVKIKYGRCIYLSEDGKTLTVIACGGGENKYKRNLTVYSIDVSEPSKMAIKSRVELTGTYADSRMVDGKLLLSYMHTFRASDSDSFQVEEGYLPYSMNRYSHNNLVQTISFGAEDIIIPDDMTLQSYTICVILNESNLRIEDKVAVLSVASYPMVYDGYIVLDNAYTDTQEKIMGLKNVTVSQEYTDLYMMSYGKNGFDYRGEIRLEGYITDRYSVDIYNGILRVVTTTKTETQVYEKILDSDVYDGRYSYNYDNVNAHLWCYDVEKGEMIASVRAFAPDGDDVRSVRFVGDSAYVCTAKTIKDEEGMLYSVVDPVYFFDLSDLNNITYSESDEIDGYSFSLSTFKDGTLIGIGRGDRWDTLKIEIYEEKRDRVEIICTFERKDIGFSDEYKAFFIDRENGYIGLSYSQGIPGEKKSHYLLLKFNGECFEEVINIEGEEYFHNDLTRSAIIIGHIYVFNGMQFYCEKLPE